MTPTVTPPTQVPPAVEPTGHGGDRRPRERRRGPGSAGRPAPAPEDDASEETPVDPGEGHVDVIA